jgi:hypothetical protein
VNQTIPLQKISYDCANADLTTLKKSLIDRISLYQTPPCCQTPTKQKKVSKKKEIERKKASTSYPYKRRSASHGTPTNIERI